MVDLPFGARLGVGADGEEGQPLLRVIEGILQGQAEVWISQEEDLFPIAHAARVFWGANSIQSGDVGSGLRVIAPRWTR